MEIIAWRRIRCANTVEKRKKVEWKKTVRNKLVNRLFGKKKGMN